MGKGTSLFIAAFLCFAQWRQPPRSLTTRPSTPRPFPGQRGRSTSNFNPGPLVTQAASLQILDFTSDGILAGSPTLTGDVAGALPATLTFDNGDRLQRLLRGFHVRLDTIVPGQPLWACFEIARWDINVRQYICLQHVLRRRRDDAGSHDRYDRWVRFHGRCEPRRNDYRNQLLGADHRSAGNHSCCPRTRHLAADCGGHRGHRPLARVRFSVAALFPAKPVCRLSTATHERNFTL